MSRRICALIVIWVFYILSTPSSAQEAKQPVPKNQSLNVGILHLRQHQKECRQILKIVPKHTEKEVLELSLKQARLREEQSIQKGEYIRVGVFKYPAQIEKLRWKQTRDIIHRIMPGMDEDPVYIEILARQAASIEMVLRKEYTAQPNLKASALLDRVLLGTVPDLNWVAFNAPTPTGDYSLVVLSDGLISFLFQAAKCVVLSWRPMKAEPGATVSLSTGAEDIEYVLSRNPYTQELLYKTLYAWLFKGYPRTVGYKPPLKEYRPALELLINHSERFVIAHEYGHGLLDELASVNALPHGNASRQEEYGADAFAFFLVLLSATEIDLIAPNVALQGGIFVLTALDVIRQALDIVRCGEVRKDMGSNSHPALQQRIEFLKNLYRKHVGINVKYDVQIEEESSQSKTINLDIEGASIAANTLNLLWQRIQNHFIEAHHKGKKLHSMWGNSFCN